MCSPCPLGTNPKMSIACNFQEGAHLLLKVPPQPMEIPAISDTAASSYSLSPHPVIPKHLWKDSPMSLHYYFYSACPVAKLLGQTGHARHASERCFFFYIQACTLQLYVCKDSCFIINTCD